MSSVIFIFYTFIWVWRNHLWTKTVMNMSYLTMIPLRSFQKQLTEKGFIELHFSVITY